MAIMHVQMMGILENDPVFFGDGEHNEYITFTMIVKEKGQKTPFTVYISHENQMKKCTDLIKGCAVLVDGIINIEFHNIHNRRITTEQAPYPVITSDMILICNELYPFYTQNRIADTSSQALETQTALTEDMKLHYFDLVDELPF